MMMKFNIYNQKKMLVNINQSYLFDKLFKALFKLLDRSGVALSGPKEWTKYKPILVRF